MSIQVGDIVQVNIDSKGLNLILLSAEVLHIPCATGDSWCFMDLCDPREIWTTEPITIFKRGG